MSPVPSSRDEEETRQRLQAWLAPRLGNDVVVSDLTVPDGSGYSNETLLFSAAWTAGGEQRTAGYAARVRPIGYAVFPEYDLSLQYRVSRGGRRQEHRARPDGPVVRAGGDRARRPLLRHGPGHGPGAARQPALHGRGLAGRGLARGPGPAPPERPRRARRPAPPRLGGRLRVPPAPRPRPAGHGHPARGRAGLPRVGGRGRLAPPPRGGAAVARRPTGRTSRRRASTGATPASAT